VHWQQESAQIAAVLDMALVVKSCCGNVQRQLELEDRREACLGTISTRSVKWCVDRTSHRIDLSRDVRRETTPSRGSTAGSSRKISGVTYGVIASSTLGRTSVKQGCKNCVATQENFRRKNRRFVESWKT
jgi:hypothetical protein